MLKRILVLVSVLVLTTLIASPVMAGASGPGVTGVQIQNLSTTAGATVNVQLWPQGGGTAIDLIPGGTTINASAAKNIYLPNYSSVNSGLYSMVVSSNQPAAAIARTDWSSTGGGAIYQSVEPATDVTLPLALAGFANQTTQFSVQNTDTAADATDVIITLYGRGQSAAVKALPAQTIAKGTSKSWNLGDTAVWGTLPNTGIDMGSNGFVGSIRITSAKPLAVQSFIDLPGTPGVGGFSGVSTTSASATLYCPLIRANYYGDTGISVVNPNAAQITATITFTSDNNSPSKGTFTQTLTVGPNSSAVAFQGPGGNSRSAPTSLPGGSGQTSANPTPTNTGFYGVAKITTTGGNALAVVNDTKFGAGWAVKAQSTYNCGTSTDAGTSFALPLVRRYHLASTKLTTGIQIQNTGGTQITASLSLVNWDGSAQAASNPTAITIPANGSGNFWNGNLTGLPTVPASAGGSGWYGSAILTVTGGSAVVVVSDEGYGATAVDSANYNGLKIQ